MVDHGWIGLQVYIGPLIILSANIKLIRYLVYTRMVGPLLAWILSSEEIRVIVHIKNIKSVIYY